MTSQLQIFSSPPPPIKAPQEVTWKIVLQGEKEQQYFQDLMRFIESERAAGKVIYPKKAEVFHALQATPFADVKVVILGQDPYHGPGQAHGLCFSVVDGVPPPPSLENIFKELSQDLAIPRPAHGNLECWARQGVLLLNAVLTVEAGKAGSHANRGWERFTDRIVRELNDKCEGLVFLLWGSYAQRKGEIIETSKHCVLKSAHPSPLSASKGFFGCKHFSRANHYLQSRGLKPIDWDISRSQ